jgi:hypothetical protein
MGLAERAASAQKIDRKKRTEFGAVKITAYL